MRLPSDTELLGAGVVTLVVLIIVLGILWPRDAEAGIACHPLHASLGPTISNQCEYGSTNNDFLAPPPLQVNKDKMFKFDDWQLWQKRELQDGVQIFGLTTPTTLYDNVMLVLKGPANYNYMGWLLPTEGSTFAVRSPFTPIIDFSPRKYQDISHYTLYQRVNNSCEDCGETPIPGTLWLLALGAFPILRRQIPRRSSEEVSRA